MMIRRILCVLALLTTMLLPLQASAEVIINDTFKIETTIPEGWNSIPPQDAKTIFNFTDPKNANRIEGLATKILRQEHGEVLFDGFTDQLLANGFTEAVEKHEVKFGEYTGNLVEYDYISADAPMRVMTFLYLKNNMAYVIVSYAGRTDREESLALLENVVASMKLP